MLGYVSDPMNENHKLAPVNSFTCLVLQIDCNFCLTREPPILWHFLIIFNSLEPAAELGRFPFEGRY